MTPLFRYALAVFAAVACSGQALACYTVYNRANQVVYHAAAAPVDMRYPLHQTLPAVFPQGHLVFSVADTHCPQVNHTRAPGQPTSATLLSLAPGEVLIIQPPRR
jgi:hypothetical protein